MRLETGWKTPACTQEGIVTVKALHIYPPIMTVGEPNTMTPPWAVLSPNLAAGFEQIITVPDPLTIVSGGPTQVALSPTTDAGKLLIITVGAPGPVTGPPTCGTGGNPGVTIGHVCMSVILAAGGISISLYSFLNSNQHHQLIITMAPFMVAVPEAVSSALALPFAE